MFYQPSFSSDAIKSKTACFKDVMQLRASTIDMKTSESVHPLFTLPTLKNTFLFSELSEAETELAKQRVSYTFLFQCTCTLYIRISSFKYV